MVMMGDLQSVKAMNGALDWREIICDCAVGLDEGGHEG